MKAQLQISLWAALFLLAANTALALSGDEILKKAEQTMNAPKDRTAIQTMTLVDSTGATKKRTIRFFQKGSEKRLVVFTEPAEVKGVGFLSLTEERMYLYLPAFRKVRRISSSIKNEDFMGTDFSYEDLAETRYTDDYSAVLAGENGDRYILDLTPKPGADVSYAHKRMWVDKKTFVPTKTEYYAKNGQLIKTLTALDIRLIDGYWFPATMKMVTRKPSHSTVLKMREIEHDTGLSDRFFTERNLKKQAR